MKTSNRILLIALGSISALLIVFIVVTRIIIGNAPV